MEDYAYIILVFGLLAILCIGCHCFRIHEQQNRENIMRRLFVFGRHSNSIDVDVEETKEEPSLEIIIHN